MSTPFDLWQRSAADFMLFPLRLLAATRDPSNDASVAAAFPAHATLIDVYNHSGAIAKITFAHVQLARVNDAMRGFSELQ